MEKTYEYSLFLNKLILSVSFDCRIGFLWKFPDNHRISSKKSYNLQANSPELIINETLQTQAILRKDAKNLHFSSKPVKNPKYLFI